MSIAARLTLALAVIFAGAFALTIYLDLHKFERTLQDMSRSRVMVRLDDLSDSIEMAMNLGLGLDAVDAAQDLVVQLREIDPDLSVVSVIGVDGRILFDTRGDAAIGKPAPADWTQAQRGLVSAKPAEIVEGWQVIEPADITNGVLLRTNLGGVAGSAVAVRLRGGEHATLALVTGDMIRAGLAIGAATLILMALAVTLVLRPLGRRLNRMSEVAGEIAAGETAALDRLADDPFEQHLRSAGSVAAAVLHADRVSLTDSLAVVEDGGGDGLKRRFLAVFAVALVLLAAGLGGISWYAVDRFSDALLPEFQRKADAIGQSLTDRLDQAIAFGVPFNELRGVDEMFRTIIKENPEIAGLAVGNPNSHSFVREGRLDGDLSSYPIKINGITVERLQIAVNQGYVADRMGEILQDLLTVLLVSLLITFEVLMVLLVIVVSGPIGLIDSLLARVARGDFTRLVRVGSGGEVGRLATRLNDLIRRVNQRLAASAPPGGMRSKAPGREKVMPLQHVLLVRIPLFLFIFAEELTRPFLPIYIKSLYRPLPWLSPELAIGLPISVFMLTIAAVTPWAGVITDRLGTRRVFLIGVVPSIVGFIGTAFAGSLLSLVIWRGFCAAGYAIVYIACQGFFAQAATAATRTRGMALFMGAVFAAAICGPSIGGILADRLGASATLLFSAIMVALAAVLVWRLLPELPRPAVVRKMPRWSDLAVIARNRRLVVLTLLAAVPSKLILTGFLFYLVPLYLAAIGATQATIGRVVMVYGLMNVVCGPLMARWADKSGHLVLFVGLGGILSGLGMLTVWQASSTWTVLAAVTIMGIAHAASIAPQLSLVQEVTTEEARAIGQTSVLSIFRLVERFGNVAGPFVTAAFYQYGGYAGATIWTGLLVACCSLAFLVMMHWLDRRPAVAAAASG